MPVDVQLDHQQLRQLHEALLAAFTSRIEFERMLFFSSGRQLSHLASDNLDLSDAVFKVVVAAQAAGWIETLVEGAHKVKPAQPQLRRFVKELFADSLIALAADDEASGDPLDAYFLGRERIFIDRAQLRDALRELTMPGITPRILAVHSDLSLCGKTYTYEFIRFFALSRQERVAYVDLLEEISLGNGTQELVEQLGRKLRADLSSIPEQEAQTARWLRALAVWLIGQIRGSGQFWWLVFDSINQVEGLPKEIHDFIQRLASQLEEEDDPPCRLVLISYRGKEQLPLQIRARIKQEEIHQEILPNQLKDFLVAHVRRLLGENGDETQVRDAADMLCEALMNKLSTLPEEARPYALSSVLEEVLAGLEASLVVQEPTG
jgi:hypothetical protein